MILPRRRPHRSRFMFSYRRPWFLWRLRIERLNRMPLPDEVPF